MERLRRASLLVLYQITLLAGIALMPLALVASRLGFRLPLDRPVVALKKAYERTDE
jgi:hypothetical protein